MKIIEAVPNFSIGSEIPFKENSIRSIIKAVDSVKETNVLHVDSGKDANRTVITFAGAPEAVVESAFRAIKVASEVIDMRFQKGKHPRIGATDVCPLVPVSNITMDEVVKLSYKLSKRVAEELNIPVYNYEYSASSEERRLLANIRGKGYEWLKAAYNTGSFNPDFGQDLNMKAGATVIGARKFLIAYNVNLVDADLSDAKEIASIIRESSGIGLKGVRAIGWYIKDFDRAQVSTNITDFDKTSVFKVFDTVKELAGLRNIKVSGSELIGLIPERALMDNVFSTQMSNNQRIYAAVDYLGLGDLNNFDFQKRIIERVLA